VAPPAAGAPALQWSAAFVWSGEAAPAHENPNEPAASHPGTASSSSHAAVDFAKGMQQWLVSPGPGAVAGPQVTDGSAPAGESGPAHE
jgi:hypothetical protein